MTTSVDRSHTPTGKGPIIGEHDIVNSPSCIKFSNLGGTVPVSEVLETLKVFRFEQLAISEGMVPVIFMFPETSKDSKFEQDPNSDGNVPSKLPVIISSDSVVT